MSPALNIVPRFRPALDPEFLPAVLWIRAYADLVARDPGARPVSVVDYTTGRMDRFRNDVITRLAKFA